MGSIIQFFEGTGDADAIKDLKGVLTDNGTIVTGVSNHAEKRMEERGISAKDVRETITNPDSSYPGTQPDTTSYQKGNIRVVVGSDGTIITVVNLGN